MPSTPPDPADRARYEAYLHSRIQTLLDLALAEDDQSLRVMLGELKNPDASIREVALEAVRQCGRREAIPVLEALAAQAPDPVEAVALEDAADFLALPSVSEMRDRLRPERAPRQTP